VTSPQKGKNWTIVLKSFSYGTQVMGHPVLKMF
jgi:hypothetical protein